MKPLLVTCGGLAVVGSALAAAQALTPQQAAARAQTIQNVKEVSLACLMYAADYDDVFPTARSQAGIKKVVAPYFPSAKGDLWKTSNPAKGAVLYNLNLSGVSSVVIEMIAEVPMVYETKPWPDGRRVVGYTDGHVKAIDQPTWQRLQPLLNKKWPKAEGGRG